MAVVAVMASLVALRAWGQPGPGVEPAAPPSPVSPPRAPAGPQGQSGSVDAAPAGADWLQKNLKDPRWPEALAAFVRQTPELQRIRSALEPLKELPQHLPAELALQIGGLLEVAGSPEAALRYYGHSAAKADSPAVRATALLARAALSCDLGEDESALLDLDDALTGLSPGALRCRIETARLLLRHEVRPDSESLRALREAADRLPADSPGRLHVLLLLVDEARAAGQTDDLNRYLSQLERDFGQSPEAVLASGSLTVTRAFSPRYLFRALATAPEEAPADAAGVIPEPLPPSPPAAPEAPAAVSAPSTSAVRIQTGSFTVAENATFMARDLAEAGFATTTEKVLLAGKAYYRVFLSKAFDPEEARTTLIRLKEAGFEGVLVP